MEKVLKQPMTIENSFVSLSITDYEEFILCARFGELEEIEKILKAFPTFNLMQTDNNGNTALHMAAANGHNDVLALLLSKGPSDYANVSNNEGNRPLHWACLNGHLETVKILLEHGADIQAKNINEKTCLYEANTSGKEEISRFLIDFLLENEEKGEPSISVGK